jgi:hypothetical protein
VISGSTKRPRSSAGKSIRTSTRALGREQLVGLGPIGVGDVDIGETDGRAQRPFAGKVGDLDGTAGLFGGKVDSRVAQPVPVESDHKADDEDNSRAEDAQHPFDPRLPHTGENPPLWEPVP